MQRKEKRVWNSPERVQETTTIWILWQNGAETTLTNHPILWYVTELDLCTELFPMQLASWWLVRTIVWLYFVVSVLLKLLWHKWQVIFRWLYHLQFTFCITVATGGHLCASRLKCHLFTL